MVARNTTDLDIASPTRRTLEMAFLRFLVFTGDGFG